MNKLLSHNPWHWSGRITRLHERIKSFFHIMTLVIIWSTAILYNPEEAILKLVFHTISTLGRVIIAGYNIFLHQTKCVHLYSQLRNYPKALPTTVAYEKKSNMPIPLSKYRDHANVRGISFFFQHPLKQTLYLKGTQTYSLWRLPSPMNHSVATNVRLLLSKYLKKIDI